MGGTVTRLTTNEMRELAIENGVYNFEFDSWLDTLRDEDWEEYAREDDTARYHDDMHHEGTVRWCTEAYCKGEA